VAVVVALVQQVVMRQVEVVAQEELAQPTQ
jgi:hypothetical protein